MENAQSIQKMLESKQSRVTKLTAAIAAINAKIAGGVAAYIAAKIAKFDASTVKLEALIAKLQTQLNERAAKRAAAVAKFTANFNALQGKATELGNDNNVTNQEIARLNAMLQAINATPINDPVFDPDGGNVGLETPQ